MEEVDSPIAPLLVKKQIGSDTVFLKIDRSKIGMQAAWHGEPAGAGVNEAGHPGDRTTVAVIIPVFNQARFLGEAITSVLAQTRVADEIVVVDDGSTDNPANVVAQFPTVQFFRQDNRGPSAARNMGLLNCTTTHVVFLDGDDRLLPKALESGLACIATRPDCAFVYGGHRRISEDGVPISADRVRPIEGDAHLALLRWNPIIMHASVIYRRDRLLAVNGFDETLRRAEDFDLYLRLSRRYSLASHPETVAEYRRHGQNASNDYIGQLKTIYQVFDRHEACIDLDAATRAALRDGRAREREFYISAMLRVATDRWQDHHQIKILTKDLIQAARWSPRITISTLIHALGRRAIRMLPQPIVQWIDWIRGRR